METAAKYINERFYLSKVKSEKEKSLRSGTWLAVKPRRLTCRFIVLQAKGHLLGLGRQSSTHLWSRSNTHLHAAAHRQRGFHSNTFMESCFGYNEENLAVYMNSVKQTLTSCFHEDSSFGKFL